jgi:membrane fusion protein (multidrug efflux system)
MMKRVLVGLGAVGLLAVAILALRGPKSVASDEDQAEAPTVVAVRVALITRTTLHGYVDAWGTVEPQQATGDRPPASARIATPVAGIVAQVDCAEDQRVRKGATLFRLDSRVADVAVAKAKQAVQFAEQSFDRQKKLGAGEATSQKLYQEAEQNLLAARNELVNAETQRALLLIQAPLGGTVVKVNARPGDAVDLSSALAEVIDLDRLVISVVVRSADIARVRLGQRVELSAGTSSPSSRPLASPARPSAVVFIGSQVDGRTDTVVVRASAPAGAGLRPGQFVNVRLVTEERPDRLVVPAESIVSEGGESVIAIVEGDRATKRPVKVGLRDGDLVEVEGVGLKEGLTVVTTGAYGLPKETRIRVIGRQA